MNRLSRRRLVVGVALVGLLVVSTGGAQELRGKIIGEVTDPSGGRVPGVTVTAASTALIQPQVIRTGADGRYRFPALPSGDYTLTFELDGFRHVRWSGLKVHLNATLTVNAKLELADVEETLNVTSEAPVVDISTTSIGTSFTRELLQDIPNARDIWAAMAQAPGFQMDGYDVGGSHTGTQTGYRTYGLADQNKTLLEGINVTENTAANAGYFDFGSFQEFELGGAGNMGEQAGPGALLNITVKSGGDQLHGQVYFDYEDDGSISDNLPTAFQSPGGIDDDGFSAPSRGLSRGNPITEQFDANLGVGGAAIKRKLWFYAGYRKNSQFKTILGVDAEAETELENFTGKLTYAINPSNQLIGFYNERTKLQPLRALSLTRPVEAAWYQASTNEPMKLEWTSVLTGSLFLDVQASEWTNQFPLYPTQTQSPSVVGVPVGRVDLDTGQQSGADDFYHDRTVEKPQYSGALSFYQDDLKGSHDFKFGFEVYDESRALDRFQPGNIYYRDDEGVPVEVDIYNTPNTAINETDHRSIYAQDSWRLAPRVTLNLGVRWESYKMGWPGQSFTPQQRDFFDPVSVGATTIKTLSSLSPRLGVAWDLTGNSRTVFKAFFGRFYYNPSVLIGDDENPVGAAQLRYEFNDLNGNRLLDGPQELGRFLSTLGGGGFVRIDRNLDHMYANELSTHVEHQLYRNVSLRGSYVYKGVRDGWAEVDLARAFAYDIPFEFTDPGADNVVGTGDDQVLNLFDRPTGLPEDRVFTNPGQVGLPEYKGDYHTVEAAVQRRFTNGWLLLSSFEHTWAHDYRAVGSSTSTLRADLQGTAYNWEPNLRRFGRQSTTFWNYKLVGRYTLPYGIGIGASYKLQSGRNFTRTVRPQLPTSGARETLHASRLEDARAPSVHIVDFRLEKAFKLPGDFGNVTGMIDVFNLLNENPVTNFRLQSGSRYKEVIALLDPRIVRFGVRFDF